MNTTLNPDQRIDDFIKGAAAEAQSESFDALEDKSNRLRTLGFGSTANAKYADFLAAFRSAPPALVAHYKEVYPNSMFLPWDAVHAVRKTMDLWFDLPANYVGAVPDDQLEWMELFDFYVDDLPDIHDLIALLELDDRARELALKAWQEGAGVAEPDFSGVTPENASSYLHLIDFSGDRSVRRTVHAACKDMDTSYFVLAPKDAFAVEEDWITRARRLTLDAIKRETEPPNDPLVVHCCKGGCLVVAAWGDEAAVLNQTVKDLKL